MYSVRLRLMIVLAVGFAFLIAGTSYYVQGLLGRRVTEEFDDALLAKARILTTVTERLKDGRIAFDYEPALMPEFERDEQPNYFEIYLDSGLALRKSTRLGKDAHLPLGSAYSTEPRVADIRLPDGRAGRMLQLGFMPELDDEDEDDAPTPAEARARSPANPGLILVVARGREGLDDLLARMRLAMFGGGGVAIVLGVLLVWRALVSGFRPIEEIASQVKALDAESLDSRVHLVRTPRELAPVVNQLNALLLRLSASFERERRFTANVAHELRTPVAELRSLADVGGKWPEDREATVRFFGDAHDIAGRMETVISDLLLLARCDAGVEKAVRFPTNLKEVLNSTWSRLSPGEGHEFRVDLPDDPVVESDPGKLGIIFTNVLGNAVSYAPPDSEIRCVGTRSGSRFRLEFSNPAAPLSEQDLAHLAEPFWRKDEARSYAGHAGLGLSVVSALAALLRLDVAYEQDQNGTFRVRLEGWG